MQQDGLICVCQTSWHRLLSADGQRGLLGLLQGQGPGEGAVFKGAKGGDGAALPPASSFPEEKAFRAATRKAVVDLVNEQQGSQLKTAAQVRACTAVTVSGRACS